MLDTMRHHCQNKTPDGIDHRGFYLLKGFHFDKDTRLILVKVAFI